jgi:hypothetical protein
MFVVALVVASLAASAAAFALVGGRLRQPVAKARAAGAAATEEASPAGEAAARDKDSTRGRVPVVVELFTSEGCSSCPPADALLGRLEETQPVEGAEVFVLAQHVDYWNYIGWTDPFSSRESSERQGEYARAFKRDGVYTPQMVVDGREEFPGGNAARAFEAIGRAAREPKTKVTLTLEGSQPDGALRLSVRADSSPAPSEAGATEVLLAVTEGGLSSDVARGENTGRRLAHVGVVRRLTKLGEVGPGPFTAEPLVALEKGWRRENLRAVVFLQQRASRRVVGAASIKLSS